MNQQILSQDEVDALLQGITGESQKLEQEEQVEGSIRNYDLASQERIVRGRMPTMEIIGERFARNIRIGLFNFIRKSPEVSINGIKVQKYSAFLREIVVPTNFNIVSVRPLRGSGLIERVEQVVRLIRSKGVGVFFVTQNPLDIPDTVLGQLGNRVQHALRAYTPRDQKAVQAAAETFRANPQLNTATAITELGVGEALVSFLDEKGRPNVVERAYVMMPGSQIGPITDDERKAFIASSVVAGVYEKVVDRESAYEKLKGRAAQQPGNAPAAGAPANTTVPAEPESSGGGLGDLLKDAAGGFFGNSAGGKGGSSRRESPVEAMVKSAARSIGSQVGREIIRGVLGSLLKKR